MSATPNELTVIDRKTGRPCAEPVLGGALLRLAYESSLRPLARTLLMRTGWLSRLLGWYTRTGASRRDIRRAIEQLGIDESEFLEPTRSFRTFHDFFVRRLDPACRPFDPQSEALVSPADARLTVIPEVRHGTAVPVKGCRFEIVRLLGRPREAAAFESGQAFVFRLCPADYHRFHYPADGSLEERYEISGRYDSVNPIALNLGIPVFTENRRVVSLLTLEVFGRCAFVEVGAFGVAGITETHRGTSFSKMDEKGFFHYGASTVILLLEHGALQPAPDLVQNTTAGFETLVRAGETLGRGAR